MNLTNVHVCTVNTFPQAALKSVCIFLKYFFSLTGSFIYVLQLNHQNIHYDACLKVALCFGFNYVHRLIIFYICFSLLKMTASRKLKTQRQWQGAGTHRLLVKTKCHAAQCGEMQTILLDLYPQISKLQS